MSLKPTSPFSIIRARVKWISKRFSVAPIELKVFAIFAAAVTILWLVIAFLPKGKLFTIYRKAFDVNTSGSYMFALIFVFFLICHIKGSKPFAMRNGIVAPLIVTVVFKCLILLDSIDGNNKFIIPGYWILVWSFIIPIFWILFILFSPGISKFCRSILLFQKTY